MIWIEAVRPATKSETKHGKVEQTYDEKFIDVLQRAIGNLKKTERNAEICQDMPRNDG